VIAGHLQKSHLANVTVRIFSVPSGLLLTFRVQPINLSLSDRQRCKHYKLRFRLRKILVTFTYL